MSMRISLVVAAARNRVIGHRGAIPWRLPDDQRFFRDVTTGHCVVMGRKTFEELNRRPLPNRENYVLSRRPQEPVPGVEFFPNLAAALDRARERAFRECFIAGGEALYREGLALADRIYLTRVDAEPPGDTWFPEIDERSWRCVARDERPVDDRHPHAFTFETWDRVD
ncbi:MAG TPA: dihydrofolate reductase [Deltaproteobacteria bacterium]|nr:dihydrofolate reductase [Deltaproteobacteria bacterium]